jgi:hypothetical protein
MCVLTMFIDLCSSYLSKYVLTMNVRSICVLCSYHVLTMLQLCSYYVLTVFLLCSHYACYFSVFHVRSYYLYVLTMTMYVLTVFFLSTLHYTMLCIVVFCVTLCVCHSFHRCVLPK